MEENLRKAQSNIIEVYGKRFDQALSHFNGLTSENLDSEVILNKLFNIDKLNPFSIPVEYEFTINIKSEEILSKSIARWQMLYDNVFKLLESEEIISINFLKEKMCAWKKRYDL